MTDLPTQSFHEGLQQTDAVHPLLGRHLRVSWDRGFGIKGDLFICLPSEKKMRNLVRPADHID